MLGRSGFEAAAAVVRGQTVCDNHCWWCADEDSTDQEDEEVSQL